MSNSPLRIRFYVDGLNFYHGVAKQKRISIKWIDIEKLLLHLVRNNIADATNATVEKILIFTAPVIDIDNARQRQLTYLGALAEHSPCIEIKRDAYFQSIAKTGRIAKYGSVSVKIREEKRTDVNLACRIVEDAFATKKDYDIACLVCDDSDLVYALEVKRKHNQRVLLITPRTRSKKPKESPDRVVRTLEECVQPADIIKSINKKLVADCTLPDQVGKYTKPLTW